MKSFNRVVASLVAGGVLTVSVSSSFAQALPGYTQQAQQPGTQATNQQGQLSSLVAPIALYPDNLLSQVLMASTYPTQIVEAAQWQAQNKNLTGDALNNALKGQDWDPSVKGLVSVPSVLQMMAGKLSWTQQLGDAFLKDQNSVMNAVQQLRALAKQNGNLKSSPQQSVTTATNSGTTVIVIEPTNPQVVYVPTYNPAVVYGQWPYPYYAPPPVYPYGYNPIGTGVSFAAGMLVGAAIFGACHWGGGGWGGGNSVVVNNNNYNRFGNASVNNFSANRGSSSGWQHNSNYGGGGMSDAQRNAARQQAQQNMNHYMSSHPDAYSNARNDANRFGSNHPQAASDARSDARTVQRQNTEDRDLRSAQETHDRSTFQHQMGGMQTAEHGGGGRSFGGGHSFGGFRR